MSGLEGYVLAAVMLLSLPAANPRYVEGQELVGVPAPPLEITDWVKGGPLTLEDLRGRVVLIRWWSGPGCPYCGPAASYLNSWHERYEPGGLSVVGLYHHKSTVPLTREYVRGLIEGLGFHFSVGIDTDWRTLKRWWLERHERSFTSVTFLLDKDGVIRMVHPGGVYLKGEARAIERMIRKLIAGPSKQDHGQREAASTVTPQTLMSHPR